MTATAYFYLVSGNWDAELNSGLKIANCAHIIYAVLFTFLVVQQDWADYDIFINNILLLFRCLLIFDRMISVLPPFQFKRRLSSISNTKEIYSVAAGRLPRRNIGRWKAKGRLGWHAEVWTLLHAGLWATACSRKAFFFVVLISVKGWLASTA